MASLASKMKNGFRVVFVLLACTLVGTVLHFKLTVRYGLAKPSQRITSQGSECSPEQSTKAAHAALVPRDMPTLLEIGTTAGTDKVVANKHDNHGYHRVYMRYMEGIRDQPVKLMEIGLGCSGDFPGGMRYLGSAYTAGRSVEMWKKYLSRVELWMAEADRACAEGLKKDLDRGYEILIGDQSDKATLQQWVEQTGGEFDFIVDDGGHETSMIMSSFDVLFHSALKPGGTYFVEDLHYQKDADVTHTVNGKHVKYKMSLALSEFSQWLLDNTASKAWKLGLEGKTPKGLMNVDCYHDMCAFTKYDCAALDADPTLLASHDVKWCKERTAETKSANALHIYGRLP